MLATLRGPGGRSAGLIAGTGLLIATWAMTTPPFSAPDEADHYLRTLSVGAGQLIGSPAKDARYPALDPVQEAWVLQSVREIDVRAGMVPDGFACNAFRPEVSAGCATALAPPAPDKVRRLTTVGTYQPALYLLPGLVTDFASDRVVALRLGRFTFGGLSFFLIAAGLACFAIDLATSLGALLALTPMVLFMASVLSPSGPEIAAGFALWAGLLSLTREGAGRDGGSAAHRRGLATVMASGTVLALSRSMGPLWIALMLGACLVWVGPRRALEIARRTPRLSSATVLLVGAACVFNRVWDARYGPALRSTRHFSLRDALGLSAPLLPRWAEQQIGNFQYLETPMPPYAYAIFFGVAAGLLLGALITGRIRDRLALAALAGLVVAVPLLLHAFLMLPWGWNVQGRHVLPFTVALPVFAGEVLSRRAFPGRVASALMTVACALCGVVQLVGLHTSARRSAVGLHGPWWFLSRAEWSPPLGWAVWGCVALAGAVALIAAAVVRRAHGPRTESPQRFALTGPRG